MSKLAQSERPDPLSIGALRQHIRLALDKGYFQEKNHAENDHPERNLSIDDVIHGLERKDWILEREPNYDEEHRGWEYLIKTVDIDGDELHIKLCAHPADKRIDIITRW